MRKSFIDRLFLPTIVSLSTVVFSLVILQQMLTQQQADVQASAKEQALLVKNRMESELKANILPLELLRERWGAASYQLDFANMESDARLAMSSYPAYQAIEWVEPTFRVQWVVPHEGNEADLGADLGADQQRSIALQAAKDSGRVMATRSVDLRQGGRGVLVCVPLIRNGTLSGFLLGVFRYQGLLDSVLRDVAPDSWVAVSDGDGQIYRREGATPPQKDVVQEEDIEFQQLAWHVQVWPAPEKPAYPGPFLPLVTFVGGLVMATWLAVTIYTAETARLRARELAAANNNLHKEIIEREHAEKAMRDAQKMEVVGRLAGGVAHDFNNMLTVIRSRAELSLNGLGSEDPLHRELNDIVQTADRASSLTRQLLAFGRKQVLQSRVLNLNTVVAQVAALLPPVLGVDIKLSLDLDSDLGRVKADSSQFEQIIMNLAFNARDAMPKGGTLTIRTENAYLDETWVVGHPEVRPGSHVLLAVRDTGCGMDAQTQSHMFEPFFTTKDSNRGTGLGLASVYGTVHQSGGCITVSSKLGEGTTIQIYLPRVEEAARVVETPQVQPRSLDGVGTILVVEDDDAVRRMTREILMIRGYQVVDVRSGADAIRFMEGHKETIDLVLTDVSMPEMKGQELGERLAKLHPGIRLLYMSAYSEDAVLNEGILRPGMAFIEKPFSADELARKVRAVLSVEAESPRTRYASGT